MKLNLSSSLAGASLILIAYNIVGKGLGLIRESLYAALFGLQVEFDLYLVGAVIPTIINSIIQYIGQNYFIPAFSKVSDEESTKFLKNILYVFFISASIVTILLYISSSTIISSYLSGNSIEISELALNVFRIFILVIPINALIAVLSAYFQAKYKFVTPVASQLLFNLTILVFVFVFYAKLGIYSIPFGFLVSMLFQLIYLYAKIEKSVRRKLVFENNSFDLVKNIPAGLGIIFFIEISGQLFILIDRYFLSQVDSGGISALNYANTLFILPISIISLTFSTVVFPKFTDGFLGDRVLFSKNVNRSLAINTFLFVPITLIIFFFSEEIIKVLYFRGNFTITDVELTSSVLKIFCTSLIFFSAFALINKVMYAVGALYPLLLITLFSVGLKVGLSPIFVNAFKQNGLALTSSISYILLTVMCLIYLGFKYGLLKYFYSRDIFVSVINGFISVFMVTFLFNFIDDYWISFFMFPTMTMLIYIINSIILQQDSIIQILNLFRVITKFKVVK